MVYFFAIATCSADFVFGVRLCFWVGHSGFYSLGCFLLVSLLLQFKVDCCACLCLAGLLLFSCPVCYCIVMLYDSFINLSFLFCFPAFF